MPKSSKPPNTEIEHLKSLRKDFPGSLNIDTRSAIVKIRERYVRLEDALLKEGNIANDIESGYSNFFFDLALLTHSYLFKEILSNAGEFRSIDDPWQGRIIFGGTDRRHAGRGKFRGSDPRNIKEDLIEVFNILKSESTKPIEDAIKFYQQFVNVHPFYDANGRIARLIVTIYLDLYGYMVDWDELKEKDNQFCNKLNKCHVQPIDNPHSKYEEYFGYLYDFFKQYVKEKPEQ